MSHTMVPDADPGRGVELGLAELCPGDLPHGAQLRVPGEHVRHHAAADVQPSWNSGDTPC